MFKLKLSSLYLFFLLAKFCEAQAPNIQWAKTYGGTSQDNLESMIKNNSGGFVFIGSSSSNDGDILSPQGYEDVWVFELDSAGTFQWKKNLGGTYTDHGYSIKQTLDSGYIVAASSTSNDGDVAGNHNNWGGYPFDAWIVKIDKDGNLQWQKCYGGSENDFAYDIQLTNDSGYIFCGESYSDDGDVSGHHGLGGNPDIWVVKIDNLGNLKWQKSMGGTGFESAESIIETPDSGYLITGSSYAITGIDGDIIGAGYHGFGDIFTVKLDSIGNFQWKKCYGGTSGDGGVKICNTNDGNYFMLSVSESFDGDIIGNHGSSDYSIIKISPTGSIIWSKCYGGSMSESPSDIIPTSDKGFMVSGLTVSNDGDVNGIHWPNQLSEDYWTVKCDSAGGIVWQKCLGGSYSDQGRSALEDSNILIVGGNTISNDGDVTGFHDSSCIGNCGDIWIVRLSIQSDEIDNPESLTNFISIYSLDNHVYLNYYSTRNELINYRLYESTGKILYEDKFICHEGMNNQNIFIDNVCSGIYLLQIISSDGPVVKKVFINN